MEDTNKKNIEAVVNANEVFTKDFFAQHGREGVNKRWKKSTEKQRLEVGKMLAKARKKARRLDEKVMHTPPLAE